MGLRDLFRRTAMSNTCICPKPPGGKVTCNIDQLAICGLRDGQIISGCFDRPPHTADIQDEDQKNYVLSNWVLSEITGTSRSDYEIIEPQEFEMLQSGQYVNARTGETIRFAAPPDVDFTRAARLVPATKSR